MDRRTEAALGRALEAFPAERVYHDRVGPAVYVLEPSWATLIACYRCLYVALVPSIPRVLRMTYHCESCGALIPLEPPSEILAAHDPLAVVRGPLS